MNGIQMGRHGQDLKFEVEYVLEKASIWTQFSYLTSVYHQRQSHNLTTTANLTGMNWGQRPSPNLTFGLRRIAFTGWTCMIKSCESS